MHPTVEQRLNDVEDAIDRLEGVVRGMRTQPPHTDAAARLAQEHGVDIRAVPWTGKGGKVIKSDVQRFVAGREDDGDGED